VVGLQVSDELNVAGEGPRPVNLRTDLGQLADLIEIAFSNSMDSNGRAAVREMRMMSNLPGLGLIGGMQTLMQGMGLGYVWVADGRVVGNVSVYPADMPGTEGKTWIIVNVAVHPGYQRRGIAQQLMLASMEMIANRGGKTALLQVDADNYTARRLYNRLGFHDEREWTTWRRSSNRILPATGDTDPRLHITYRNRHEWQQEADLAALLRPAERGGLGWLRPLHRQYFHPVWWRQLGDWLSMRSLERLIIRSADETAIDASLWVEEGRGVSTQLTLLVRPEYEGVYDDALIHTAVRRFGRNALTLEHPTDQETTTLVLRRYQFQPMRAVVHMRWDLS
jgi:ribosomal protein S18 acetylase RimI-like enzyme